MKALRFPTLFVALLAAACQNNELGQQGLDRGEPNPPTNLSEQSSVETVQNSDELPGSPIRDYIYSTLVEARTIAEMRKLDSELGKKCEQVYSVYPTSIEIVEPIGMMEGAAHPSSGKWIIHYAAKRCEARAGYQAVMTARAGQTPEIAVSKPLRTEPFYPSKHVNIQIFQVIRAAAQLGDPDASYQLGLSYYLGRSVERDLTLAERWFRRAANGDHPVAALAVAHMNLLGEGIEQSDERAVRWYRKAAELGEVGGQYNLGLMYLTGTGVEEDRATAIQWLEKAANQGHQKAKSLLLELRQKAIMPSRAQSSRY